MADYYLWFKALHLLSVISWMAGLLYLPRLFVYHCDAEPGSKQSETFKVMERRLLKAIMTPAMLASWLFGVCLAWIIGWDVLFSTGWGWIKLACVVILSAVHMRLAKHVSGFAKDENASNARYFRILNEVPTVLMIAIVIFVVVKPI